MEKDGEEYRLAYSKTLSRNGYEPIVSAEPLNTVKHPCFGQMHSDIVLDSTTFLPFETEKTQVECPSYSWRHNDVETDRNRFTDTNFKTTLFELYLENGVISAM